MIRELPQDFVDEQLRAIRAAFYHGKPKKFFQDRRDLMIAIAWPARLLAERFQVSATLSVYRRALGTVIKTIREKGNLAKIERFSLYFTHCVQEHMKIHGAEYYELAKAARSASDSLPAVMGRVQVGRAQEATDFLVALHKTLKEKSGRKKAKAPSHPTLFS